MKTLNEMESIKQDFIGKCLLQKPYDDYYDAIFGEVSRTSSCKVTNLRNIVHIKHMPYELDSGETLDDYCLFITLEKDPPSGMFPDEYNGVKLFYEAAGAP